MNFIHLRKYQENKSPAIALSAKGGATIAYSLVEQDSHTTICYSVAKCCDKDVFCRSLGRKISSGRFEVGQCDEVTIPSGLPREEIRKILIEKYYQSQERFFPDVRKCIK